MDPEYIQWQLLGGSLEIPDDCFVTRADFDDEEPYIVITEGITSSEKTLPVPKSLAYFLRYHFCGSTHMHNLLIDKGKREIREKIKTILFGERQYDNDTR